jgi:GNAT superfamily N-acetyltransferase
MNIAPPKPAWIIRLAQSGDADTAKECVAAAFGLYIERIGKPPGPMLADFPALIEANSVWVAEQEDKVVGVLVIYETGDGFCIDTVAVIPECQGTGVGRLLLQFAESEALRLGYESIYLYTNAKMTENQVFYPKIGYVEYDRRFDGGYDRIFYRKQLM